MNRKRPRADESVGAPSIGNPKINDEELRRRIKGSGRGTGPVSRAGNDPNIAFNGARATGAASRSS